MLSDTAFEWCNNMISESCVVYVLPYCSSTLGLMTRSRADIIYTS